jgi:DMSO/TMAO reductase YedYZ molybdopterin-dependent catalytic subunit
MSNEPKNNDGKKRTVQQEITRRTIIAFSVFVLLLVCGWLGWSWLYNQPATADQAQPLLRKGLEMNENMFSLIYSRKHQAKPYKKTDAVTEVRVNGDAGMDGELDTATWRLKVARRPGDTLVLTLADLKALPKTDVVFDFKCIEGWSQVTYWSGVRFSDFVEKYNLAPQTTMNYVGLVTPDEAYYVGNDMPSMLHPQTILCYEMNGRPLPQNQGYPLRLIIPVKYGVKHLKRIGVMYFSNDKPRDYWAERGYDYYCGL